MEKNFEG